MYPTSLTRLLKMRGHQGWWGSEISEGAQSGRYPDACTKCQFLRGLRGDMILCGEDVKAFLTGNCKDLY